MKARIAVLLALVAFAGVASGCTDCDAKCRQALELIKETEGGGKP